MRTLCTCNYQYKRYETSFWIKKTIFANEKLKRLIYIFCIFALRLYNLGFDSRICFSLIFASWFKLILITRYWAWLQGSDLDYKVLILITRYWSWLQGTELDYKILSLITRYWSWLQGTDLDYKVLILITRYWAWLQGTDLDYKVLILITRYWSWLQGTDLDLR